jgi:hypothetical protein
VEPFIFYCLNEGPFLDVKYDDCSANTALFVDADIPEVTERIQHSQIAADGSRVERVTSLGLNFVFDGIGRNSMIPSYLDFLNQILAAL